MSIRKAVPTNKRAAGKTASVSTFVSILLSVAFLGFSGLLIVNSVKSVNLAYQRSQLLDQAEGEVQDLRMRNLGLLQEVDQVSGDAFVEEQARDRLLYTKDGEYLIVLPEELGADGDGGENSDDVLGVENTVTFDSENEEGGWERWWKVLKEGV